MTGISKIAVFLDYLQPFTLFWKNLSKKTETRENIMKMDDLLIFTTLEKHKKLTEMLQFGRMLTPCKKLNAVYGLNWANFQLLRFILNIQVQLP